MEKSLFFWSCDSIMSDRGASQENEAKDEGKQKVTADKVYCIDYIRATYPVFFGGWIFPMDCKQTL